MKRMILWCHGILFFLYFLILLTEPKFNKFGFHKATFLDDILQFDLYAYVFLCFILGYHIIKFTALLTNQSVPLTSFFFLIISCLLIYSTPYFIVLALIDFLFHVVFSIWKHKTITNNLYIILILILSYTLLYLNN